MWVDPRYHDDAGHYGEADAITVDPANIVPPFPIRRVYVIYDTQPGAIRGGHAHRRLKQLCVCPSGSCVFDLEGGGREWTVILNHPTKGLLIQSGVWTTMRDFSSDCVLVVMADQPYDPDDYIHNYEAFKKLSPGR